MICGARERVVAADSLVVEVKVDGRRQVVDLGLRRSERGAGKRARAESGTRRAASASARRGSILQRRRHDHEEDAGSAERAR